MGEQLYDFQTALRELQMSEEELSNLVARGDLRVIRSGGKPMFRPSDINALKANVETDQTIIIPAGNSAPPPTDSQITIDLPDDLVDESAATVVGESAAGSASYSDDSDTGTEEIVFEDSLEVLPLDGDDAMATSAMTSADQTAIDESEQTVVEDVYEADDVEVLDDEPEERPSRRESRRQSRSVSRRQSAVYDIQRSNPAWAIVLMLWTIVMIFIGSFVAVEQFYGHTVEYEQVVEERPGIKRTDSVEVRYIPGGMMRDMTLSAEEWGVPQQAGEDILSEE